MQTLLIILCASRPCVRVIHLYTYIHLVFLLYKKRDYTMHTVLQLAFSPPHAISWISFYVRKYRSTALF